MPGDEIKFSFGKVNPYTVSKKTDKKEQTPAAPKINDPLPLVAPADGTRVDKTNLNLDINNILGFIHAQKAEGKVDTSDQATFDRINTYFKETPNIYALKQSFGLPAEVDGLDEDIAANLPPKAIAYFAQTTPLQRDRIGNDANAFIDKAVNL